MMCFNPKFCRGSNLPFFGLGPWTIIHGIAKSANTFIWIFDDTFELFFSKLSENPKRSDTGSTEFKLWQLKESPNQLTEGGGVVKHLSTAINSSTVDPMSKILGLKSTTQLLKYSPCLH